MLQLPERASLMVRDFRTRTLFQVFQVRWN